MENPNASNTAPVALKRRPPETSAILRRTRFVEHRNPYVTAAEHATEGLFLEEQARRLRGDWRKSTFRTASQTPLDLEIGTGNGEFLAHHSTSFSQRCALGIERKFKPLMQTLKRLQRAGTRNAAVLRYQADHLDDIFAEGELNDIFLFFPDPWPKTRHHKNRLVNDVFLKSTFALQRPGSLFTIKTDSGEYFEWILEHARRSAYSIETYTHDLHRSPDNKTNFRTHFERLWSNKGLTTKYLRLRR